MTRPFPSQPPWGAYTLGGLPAVLVWLSRATPLGRGATRKLLYKAFKSLSPGPVDTTLFGARVRLHPAYNVSERKALMRPDRMDPREHALVGARMAASGAILVDVGANAGLYSLDAALHGGPGARIVSIDPNPELLGRLVFNLETARADGQVRPDVVLSTIAVAISDRDGLGVLLGGLDEGSRSLEASSVVSRATAAEVPLRPLVALVAELGLARVDVMKIDVEGHEDKVLPPYLAAAQPAMWPRLIVIEHLARTRWTVDCIADAASKGYRVVLTTPNNTALEFPEPL